MTVCSDSEESLTEESVNSSHADSDTVSIPTTASNILNEHFPPKEASFITSQTIKMAKDVSESFGCKICGVCLISSFEKTEFKNIESSDKLFDILKTESVNTPELPSKWCNVGGVSLHVHIIDANGCISVCKICQLSLYSKQIPMFSIPNWVFPETIPKEMLNNTIAENIACSKVFRRSCLWRINRDHSTLRSHIVSFDNDVGTITNVLPRSSGEINHMLRVVFVGASNEDNREVVLPKHFEIRKSNVTQTLRFLCENNSLYNDVTINEDMLLNEQYVQNVQFTSANDDLDKYIPDTNKFEVIEEQLAWAKRNGVMLEEISKAGLMTLNSENMDYKRVQISASMNTWLKHANENGMNALVHDFKMRDIFEGTDWILEAYPELFPYGQTGPDVERPRKIDLEGWVGHLLQIADSRFREHHDFVFTMFNYIQRKKVENSLRHRITYWPGKNHGITLGDMEEQILRLNQNKPLTHTGIRSLLQQVRSVGSTIPHTPQRKIILRANIFGLISVVGWPAFFLTVSPNDLHSPIVKLQKMQYGDEMLNNIIRIMESNGDIDMTDALHHMEFVRNSNGNDPVGCANYFHFGVQLVLKHVLGYDKESKKYLPSILGKVKNHFGVIEQQQRKQLHIHMLVWIEGIEDYQTFHDSLQSEEFKQNIMSYLDILLCTQKLDSTNVPNASSSQYIMPSLKNIKDEDEKAEIIESQVAWVQNQKQLHRCSIFHCLKRGKTCRYNYPKPLVQTTHYDETTKKIFYKRDHQWLNHCLSSVSAVLRYNNDIQFLPGNGPPNIARYIAYYCSNYTSKDEATTMNLLEFFSRKLRELQIYKPNVAEDGRKAYMSVLRSTINKFAACNEVGGVEASSTLLGYSDHYTNAHFISINWKGWDIWLVRNLQPDYKFHSYTKLASTNDCYFDVLKNSETLSSQEMSIDEVFSLRDFKEDYLNRSTLLEKLSLFEISMGYTLDTFKKGMEGFLPLSTVSLFDTSNNVWGHIPRVSKRIPTLPWFNATSKQHGVGTEAFARLMIILFKPFRIPNDLKPVSTFEIMYLKWKMSIDLEEIPFKYMINIEKNGITGWDAKSDVAKSAIQKTAPIQLQTQNTDLMDKSERPRMNRVAYYLPPIIATRTVMMTPIVTSIVKCLQQTNAAFGERMIQKRQILTNLEEVADNYEEMVMSYLESAKTEKTCEIQWNCLKLVGKHFIDTLKKKNPPPLRMIVLGEGGTGKSFIIDTLTSMFERLNRTQDYVVCAPTGKAAINVKGDTIDGVFRFSRNSAHNEAVLPQTAPVMLAKYLLIDEISMVSRTVLGRMHSKLGFHLNGKSHILGDKSFIFFGDFLQFTPVGGGSLLTSTDGKGISKMDILGRTVFLSIEQAFELTVQKRQDDVQYLSFLRNIRTKKVSVADLKYLTDNCEIKDISTMSKVDLINTPVIVSQNTNRLYWNSTIAKAYCEVMEKELIRVVSEDVVSCQITSITLQELEIALPDYLQRTLHLGIGMNVTMLENTYKHLGIANGTEGVLTDIIFERSGRVLALQVQFPSAKMFAVKGLPEKTLLIERQKASITYQKKTPAEWSLTRHQFPVQESFCSTDYKKQGQSLHRALIDLTNGRGLSTYVKLSRTKRAASTFVLSGFTLKDLQISYPTGYDDWRETVFDPLLVETTSIVENAGIT